MSNSKDAGQMPERKAAEFGASNRAAIDAHAAAVGIKHAPKVTISITGADGVTRTGEALEKWIVGRASLMAEANE